MRYKFIFLLIVVTSACRAPKIAGTYSRSYEICAAAMKSVKKQKLVINADSGFIWTDYKDKYSTIDSSLSYGIIQSNKGEKLYVLQDTITHNKFCVFNKGKKLYFYDCEQGKKYRYSNPLKKENHN